MRAASCLNVSLRCSGSRTSRLKPRPSPTLTLPDERMLLNEILVLYSVLYFRFSAQVHFACAHDSVCKGTKNFWNVQIICNFFVWGPQRAMLEWGEQRPWSPADLVERYRLCDSSAECEVALFPSLLNGTKKFFK